MRKKLAIYGAGHTAAEITVAYKARKILGEYELCGFIDDTKEGQHLGYPILGTGNDLGRLREKQEIRDVFVTLLGDPVKRLETCLELEAQGFSSPPLVTHTLPDSTVGKGVLIDPYARIMGVGHKFKDYSVVGPFSVIEGNVTLGKAAHVTMNCNVGYNAQIGDATRLLPHAVIMPQTRIGNKCIIMPHAIINRNLEDGRKTAR